MHRCIYSIYTHAHTQVCVRFLGQTSLMPQCSRLVIRRTNSTRDRCPQIGFIAMIDRSQHLSIRQKKRWGGGYIGSGVMLCVREPGNSVSLFIREDFIYAWGANEHMHTHMHTCTFAYNTSEYSFIKKKKGKKKISSQQSKVTTTASPTKKINHWIRMGDFCCNHRFIIITVWLSTSMGKKRCIKICSSSCGGLGSRKGEVLRVVW